MTQERSGPFDIGNCVAVWASGLYGDIGNAKWILDNSRNQVKVGDCSDEELIENLRRSFLRR